MMLQKNKLFNEIAIPFNTVNETVAELSKL